MLTKIDGSFRIDGLRLLKCFDMMQNFQPLCKLRLLVLNFTLNYFYFETKSEKLSKIYSYLDQRNLACLNERDLLKFAQRIYRDTADLAQIKETQLQIVTKLDFRREGGIAYSDFFIACMDLNKLMTY